MPVHPTIFRRAILTLKVYVRLTWSTVYIVALYLGKSKKSFSTVLSIHTDYLRYLRKKETVTPLPTTPSAGARELEAPPNTNVRPPVYRPRGTPALSSHVMTNCSQVGVFKVT